jgi:hypothetical protein
MKPINLREIWEIDIKGDLFEADMQILCNGLTKVLCFRTTAFGAANCAESKSRKLPHLIPFFNAKEQVAPPISTSVSDSVNLRRRKIFPQIISNQPARHFRKIIFTSFRQSPSEAGSRFIFPSFFPWFKGLRFIKIPRNEFVQAIMSE